MENNFQTISIAIVIIVILFFLFFSMRNHHKESEIDSMNSFIDYSENDECIECADKDFDFFD